MSDVKELSDETKALLVTLPAPNLMTQVFRETDNRGLKLHSSGYWTGSCSFACWGGQSMRFEVTNRNPIGATLRITANTGESNSAIIPPLGYANFEFSCFGNEPMNWGFDINTESDALFLTWKLYSTWVPGDPSNP